MSISSWYSFLRILLLNRMDYLEAVKAVAQDTGLSQGLVNRTYRAYWRTIREYISSLPLLEDLTDDEFKKLQPNVNIPSIGKLYVTLDKYHRIKKQQEIINIKREQKYATHH